MLSRAEAQFPTPKPAPIQPTDARTKLAGRWWSGGSYQSDFGSGGYSSERTLNLSRDGTYTSRTESIVSISVSGLGGGSSRSETDQGTWKAGFDGTDSGWIEFTSSETGESWRSAFGLRGSSELVVGNVRYGRDG
jgi:hypothetical protein